jgi:glutamate dehydrogenase (NADP+)
MIKAKSRSIAGFIIQFSSAIGTFQRRSALHPTVCASVLNVFAFEQIFKNSLTTLPMGGGKGIRL